MEAQKDTQPTTQAEVPESETGDGESVICPPKLRTRLRTEPNESSSCDSSEDSLHDNPKSLTARQCAKKRKASEEAATETLVKSISRVAFPEENEATAPHRMRHLRDRILRRTVSARAAQAELHSDASAERSSPWTPSLNATLSEGRALAQPSGRSRPARTSSSSRSAEQKATGAAIRSLLS